MECVHKTQAVARAMSTKNFEVSYLCLSVCLSVCVYIALSLFSLRSTHGVCLQDPSRG